MIDPTWPARVRAWIDLHLVRVVLVVAAVATSYTTLRYVQTKSGAVSYWDAVALWALGGVFYLAAFWPAPAWAEGWRAWARARLATLSAWVQAHRVELGLLAVITLVGAAARLYALGAVPDVVSGDEGRIGSLGLSTLRGEIVSPFITTSGHSTLYLFLEGWSLGVWGTHSAFGLRFIHALAGALTVIVAYLLGRQLFDARVGLVAAALVAVSHFHIHFSRVIVAGGIMDALLAGLAVFFFWRGLQRHSTLAFVLSGLIVSLHLYIYMGGRLVILFLLAYVVVLYVVKPQLARANTGNFLVFLGGFLVLAPPMAWWAGAHPEEIMARVNRVGIYQSGWMAQEMLRTGKGELEILAEQLRQAMLVFTYYPAHGFYWSEWPMLDHLTAVPFVLGLLYALWKTFDSRFLLLNAWFWSAVIAGNVLLESPALGAYRILVVIPVVMVFAALAIVKLMDLARQGMSLNPRIPLAAAGVFLALVAARNLNYYFNDWGRGCRYEDGATRLASKMGAYLGTLNPQDNVAYLLTAPVLPSSGIHPSWAFLSEEMTIADIGAPITTRPEFVDVTKGAVFLIPPQRENERGVLRSYFPEGEGSEFTDCGPGGTTVPIGWAWRVPPEALGDAHD